MKSITQFWSDPSYRAIISPNGRYIIKHSKEENYEGYDELLLLYDKGILVREIIAENCLFIGNDYVLKFPFIGYAEDCMDLILFKLDDNSTQIFKYPDNISNILCSRFAIFHKESNKVYFYSNVQSELKDYTKFIYCLDIDKLIKSNIIDICEANLDFIPNTSFLEIFKNSLLFASIDDLIIQLELPLKNCIKINIQNMNRFTIQANEYLSRNIQAYYHQDYTRFGAEGNPDFINHLKNQFDNTNIDLLKNSVNEFANILKVDLLEIKAIHRNINFTVCIIPRAKAENTYSENQKLFKKVVSAVVDKIDGYFNGTNFIIRHKNTKTTHMVKSGHGGEGEMPYPGITKDTCNISNDVVGKDILLIDDIYTKTINIDEDAIEALLQKGARSVVFYAVGKTVSIH